MTHWIKTLIVPGAVFQSVLVGGGYGTGREVVEFISRFGPWGGLGALLLIGLLMGLLLGLSFDFARIHRAIDYRTFCKRLLGRFWVLYELMFLFGLLLVLAIVGTAAGEVLSDSFGIPAGIGIGLMLLLVAFMNYRGRDWVEKTLTAWGLLMTAVFLCFVLLTLYHYHDQVSSAFSSDEFDLKGGWWISGFKFFLYSVALAPVVIYATGHIVTRHQAWGAGIIAGVFSILPGIAFHISFMAGYPEVLDQALPVYWMLSALDFPVLMVVYVIALFGTIVQTGVGMLQGLNERMDGWWYEQNRRTIDPRIHSLIAVSAVVLSMILARVGLVSLVAKGYGSLAWMSLFIFVLPMLTLGVWKTYGPGRFSEKQANLMDRNNDDHRC